MASMWLMDNNKDKDDAATAKEILAGKVGSLKSFRGDGAYDDFDFRVVLGVHRPGYYSLPKTQ